MFELVSTWAMDDVALFFRSILAITVLVFTVIVFIQIAKVQSSGGFDSEGDVILMIVRSIVFLLVILLVIVYSY